MTLRLYLCVAFSHGGLPGADLGSAVDRGEVRLVLRQDTRTMPVYELVVAKGCAKVKESVVEADGAWLG